jgi:hypothetical protein
MLLAGLFAVTLAGCGVAPVAVSGAGAASLAGTMHGGQQPVSGSLIQLYAVGTTGDGSASTPLLTRTVVTDSAGNFGITNAFTCPSPSSQVYLVATGGNPGLGTGVTNPGIAMMAVLGRCDGLGASTFININELTTVASLVTLAPYMTGYGNLGSSSADAAQFLAALTLVRSYVDTTTGTLPGPDLPAGFYASSLEITTLADIIAACVNTDGTGTCAQLYALATPLTQGATAPTDTISVILKLLQNPTLHTSEIFALLRATPPFQPTLSAAQSSWNFPILPIVATPVITPAGGTYSTVPTITITDATANAQIFYSVDGGAALPYVGPFALSSNGTTGKAQVRVVQTFARAVGYAMSTNASATYNLPAAGSAVGIAFLQQPQTTGINTILAPVQVGYVDAYGTPMALSGRGISISLNNNPGGATLGGGVYQFTGSNGSVTFTDLTLNKLGVGYTLNAFTSGVPVVGSSPFTITPPPIVLNVAGPTIGAGATLAATFTLPTPAPAGGTVVTLTSSNPAAITIAPATVTLNAGDTVGNFTYTSVTAGTTTLRATAATYIDGTTSETTASAYITLGALPSAPGASGVYLNLPVTLSQPAPAGGLTVTLTSSSSSVAYVSYQAIFPAGATVPTTLPQIQARSFGTSLITATAPGYAPDSQLLKALGVATLSQGLTTPRQSGVNMTLTLNQAPNSSLLFNLKSDDPTIASVPSYVYLNSGTSTTFYVTGVNIGSTTIHASAVGVPDATAVVNVSGYGSIAASTTATMLTTPANLTLYSSATTPISITFTSSNPAVLLLAAATGVPGAASVTVNNITGNTATVYEQGVTTGSATVTATSASLATIQGSVTVGAPFFGFQSNFGVAFAGAAAKMFSASLGIAVNGASVGFCAEGGNGIVPLKCSLNAGLTVTVPVSYDAATQGVSSGGTINATSVTFANGAVLAPIQFTPTAVGSGVVHHGTLPSGFPVIPATDTLPIIVTQGTFSFLQSNLNTTAAGVTAPFVAYLGSTDSSTAGATVTVTTNGAFASLSTDPNVMGTSTLVLTGVHYALPTLYVQGLAVGANQLTFTAAGYKTTTATVNVSNATLIFDPASTIDFTTTTSSFPTNVQVLLTIGGTQCYRQGTFCFVNPNFTPSFTINSSNSAVGASFTASFQRGQGIGGGVFTPIGAGTTTLTFGSVPAPLYQPDGVYGKISLLGTVSKSNFNTYVAPIIGANVYQQTNVGFAAKSATANLTITSSNPQVALISKVSTDLGSGSLTFAPVTYSGTNAIFFVQGLQPGTTTLTLSAPGYTTANYTVNVLQTAIIFATSTPNLSTTAFASGSTTQVYLAEINPDGSAYAYCGISSYCYPNPGAIFSTTVTSSDLNIGAVVPTATISNSTYTGNVTFTPNDVGSTILTLAGPAGVSPSLLSRTYTVGGEYATNVDLAMGAGAYAATSVELGNTPGRAVSVTVSIADNSTATLSTDPNVIGTATSLTFNNVTCFSHYCAAGGGPPLYYVRGLKPGFTKINISAQGYNPTTATVAIYKLGMVASPTGPIAITSTIGQTPVSVPTALALLDPYSQSYLSLCYNTTPCSLSPGTAAPTVNLVSDDPSIGTFGPAAPLEPGPPIFVRSPYLPVAKGFINYSLGTQAPGYYNTTSADKLGGVASTNPANAGQDLSQVAYIEAAPVDTSVGMQMPGSFAVSATTLAYLSDTFTWVVADPTIAVLSKSLYTVGTSTISFGPFDNATYYVQGLKAGTTTVTITAGGYTSKTFTVTVRPGGFVTRQFDYLTSYYYYTLVNFTPAVLNGSGQWMANATMNPQAGATITGSISNTGIGTLGTGTIAAGATSGTFKVDNLLHGAFRLTLGAPSAGFIQPTTYQSVGVTVK